MNSHASLAVFAAFSGGVRARSLDGANDTPNRHVQQGHRPDRLPEVRLLPPARRGCTFLAAFLSGRTKRGRIIASVTQSRFMPPWKAEETSYPFRDERRLKDREIALIQR